MDIAIEPLRPDHEDQAAPLLDVELGGRIQARPDGLEDVLALPGFVATEAGGRLLGVCTLDPATNELSALAVHHDHRDEGIGGRLVEAVAADLEERGAPNLWVITTNDNLEALRLYQRHGFRITAIDPGAVDRARAAYKPSIPVLGAHGIPLRDEIILTRELT